MKNCVLFLCQEINEEYIYRYNKLKNSIPDNYDIYWICQNPVKNKNINFFKSKSDNELLETFGKVRYAWEHEDEFYDYDKYVKGGFHYQCILQYLDFYISNLNYDYYWCIEYDVYMHDFSDLFKFTDQDNSDLICSNLVSQSFLNGYEFIRWNNQFIKNINNPFYKYKSSCQISKAFFSCCRISNEYFNIIYNFYKQKYCVFFEYGLVMLAIENNMKITDLINYNLVEDRSLTDRDKVNNNSLSNTWDQKRLEQIFPDVFDTENHIIKLNTNIIFHPIKYDYKFKDSDIKNGEH